MSFESNQHKGGVRNQWKRKNVRRKLVDRERERERVQELLQEALEGLDATADTSPSLPIFRAS